MRVIPYVRILLTLAFGIVARRTGHSLPVTLFLMLAFLYLLFLTPILLLDLLDLLNRKLKDKA